MPVREKLRNHLHYRSGRGQPRRVLDIGVLPMSYAPKVQQMADEAVKTERPKQREQEEFGTEL